MCITFVIMCITYSKIVEKSQIPVNNLCTNCEWEKIKFPFNLINTEFILFIGQKRKNVDNFSKLSEKNL